MHPNQNMYKAKLWDEDKWNIHSSSYSSSKYGNSSSEDKKDIAYHEQKYGQKEKNTSSDYVKKEELEEREEKNKDVFDVEEEKKEQGIKEEEISVKAAKQVFEETRLETKKTENKKDIKTIEDAIKKAIEEEKKVIMMD